MDHSFLNPEQQTTFGAMFLGRVYYRDIDCFTHRRLDALLPRFLDTTGGYMLFTLTYKPPFSLSDQVAVTGVACQPCSVEKALQILNSGAMTLAARGSGQYETILSLYRDYQNIQQTVRIDWRPELHREGADR